MIRVFWRIQSWITLRAKPSFSIFSLCFFRSWRMSFNPHVEKGYTFEPQSYPSSLRLNLRLASPGIHGRTGLAWGNTDSDVCVQYALPNQSLEGAGSWSRMAYHLGRAMLTSSSPPHGSEKTPFSGGALPVRCSTRTIRWTVLSHRLWTFRSVPQEIPFTKVLSAAFRYDFLVYKNYKQNRKNWNYFFTCPTFSQLISTQEIKLNS